jgi:DNA-binding transcriptional regulator YiaG
MRKKLSVEDSLIQSLKDARDFERGKKALRTKTRDLPAPAPVFKSADIKKLRAALDLTQTQFAQVLNVAVPTVRSWEQGIRKPEGAIYRLLQILKAQPDLIHQL